MIPKVIHYCWFGPEKRSLEMLECIESWKKTCPDFEIKEWNELNFPFDKFPFASKMYNEKKWAFVADYVRLHVLGEDGGIYLDADMMLLQDLTPLTEYRCVLGEESPGIISAGMIGAEARHPYILACKRFYDEHPEYIITIPRILSQVFESITDKSSLKVYPPKTFYPFDAEHIKEWHGQNLGPDVYGVHLWHYSWGSPLNKFFKDLGIYGIGKKIAESLGIKTILKKLFGFI